MWGSPYCISISSGGILCMLGQHIQEVGVVPEALDQANPLR